MSRAFPWRSFRILLQTFAGLMLLAPHAHAAERGTSEWVSTGPDGTLAYKTTDKGDRIMDFSHAGYMGGGVAIPDVPVKREVKPSGGEADDDTNAVQSALDDVAKMSPDAKGFRGAVLLGRGTFVISKTLTIAASGVVLRGSGADATTLKLTGEPFNAVSVRAAGRGQRGGNADAAAGGEQGEGPRTNITDEYVPSGPMSFTVADPKGFAAGDTVQIRRPVTEAWVKLMQMHDLVRDGKPQTWIKAGSVTTTERNIAAIDGNKITLDVPLSDNFDAAYLNPPGTVVVKIAPPNRVTQCGVEKLRIQSPPQEISHSQAHFGAMRINGQDCWARDLVIDETMNSVSIGGRRITLQNVTINRKAKHQGASKPAEFAPNGTQVLLDRCTVNADNVWYIATGGNVSGPIVIHNCTFTGNGRAESHQRWSTGILFDNVRVPGGGIELRNRGSMGSGHGWSMGWGVVWNCVTHHYIVQNPPGAMNWIIGSIGKSETSPRPFGAGPALPGATTDSHGKPVAPQSLYLAQLKARLGEQALENIGYDSTEIGNGPVAMSHAQAVPDVNPELGPDLAKDRPVTTTNFGKVDRQFAGWNAIDGDDATYWKANGADLPARLEFDTEGALDINAIDLGEALDHAGAVQAYAVEGFTENVWKVLAEGTTIGEGKVHRFPKTTVWKVRLTITKATDYAAIRKLGIHRTARDS